MGGTGKGTKILQPTKISQVAKFRKPEFSQAVAKIRKRIVAACTEGSSIRDKKCTVSSGKKKEVFFYYFLLFEKIVFKNIFYFFYLFFKKKIKKIRMLRI